MSASACVQCGEPCPPDPSNRYRPFCSLRCQLVDLGRWLDGDHRIPGDASEDVLASADEASAGGSDDELLM